MILEQREAWSKELNNRDFRLAMHIAWLVNRCLREDGYYNFNTREGILVVSALKAKFQDDYDLIVIPWGQNGYYMVDIENEEAIKKLKKIFMKKIIDNRKEFKQLKKSLNLLND